MSTPRELFLAAYTAYRAAQPSTTLVFADTDADYLRAAVRALCQYDACPSGYVARWTAAQTLFGDFSAASIASTLDSAPGTRAMPRQTPRTWLQRLLELMHAEGWACFRERVCTQGALYLGKYVGVRGAFVLLRGSLYPGYATEMAIMAALSKSKLYTELSCFAQVYEVIQAATGDFPPVADTVILRASATPGWERTFSGVPISGNTHIDEVSCAVGALDHSSIGFNSKGSDHASESLQRTNRQPVGHRRYRAGY